jgi:hypothetical protein
LKEIIAECNKRVKELGELRVSFKQQFKWIIIYSNHLLPN